MNNHPSKAAVFLDRDGTVVADRGYLSTVDGIELLPDAAEALRRLAQAGFALVLITNQSGIGRGYFGPDVVEAQHRRLQELLEPSGVRFAAIEVCPHAPDQNCDCRKPEATMLKRAAIRLDIDLARSYMVGDKRSDIQAGKAAGCAAVLLGGEYPEADHCAGTLGEAADWILSSSRNADVDNA